MPETTLEPQLTTDLKSLAQDIVQRAVQRGASAAECVIREGDEFSTLVRLGQVETLKESGSKPAQGSPVTKPAPPVLGL
jgi:PmbA protein